MRRAIAAVLPASPGARWTLCAVVAIVLVNAGLAIGQALTPRPTGPSGSSFATTPGGYAAWASLLQRDGHRVRQRRADLDDGRLDPGQTLVVLDPDEVRSADTRAMRRFLQAGGRLIAGGVQPSWLDDVLRDPPQWNQRGARVATARPDTGLSPAFGSVHASGVGGWSAPGAGRPLTTGPRPLLLSARQGRGTALLLADAAPLQNRGLGAADNAALALALAGPQKRDVVFAESLQGFGRKTGVAAIPIRWRVALGGLILACLLWLASRARRIGPPEPEPPEPHPARGEHVAALAAALERAGGRDLVVARLDEATRARVAARGGVEPEAADGSQIGDDGLLAAGRALAETYEERR